MQELLVTSFRFPDFFLVCSVAPGTGFGVVIWEMPRSGFVLVTIIDISALEILINHIRVHTIRLGSSVDGSLSLKDPSSLRLGNTLFRFSPLFFVALEMDFLPPPPLDEVLYPSPLFEVLGADFRAVLA